MCVWGIVIRNVEGCSHGRTKYRGAVQIWATGEVPLRQLVSRSYCQEIGYGFPAFWLVPPYARYDKAARGVATHAAATGLCVNIRATAIAT